MNIVTLSLFQTYTYYLPSLLLLLPLSFIFFCDVL